MKPKKPLTLNYESLSNDERNYLFPASKKILSYHINSNINTIKSMLKLYNKKLEEQKYKNSEIIETNTRFKNYMDKYNEYKKYYQERDKHKIQKKSKSTINILTDTYINKGYKIPNLQKNIFHVNPLNDTGKVIQKYFDEYIKNKKKLVTHKEKNFYYLNKLKDCIQAQKYKGNKAQLELTLSNYNNKNNKDNNNSNLFLKNYFNNIINHNKHCLSENEKEIEKNNFNNYNIEKDEHFLQLNEYEQNNIKQLIKEREEIKKYKSFVEKALKDKKYFKVIDCDDVELNKKRELKTINSIKTSSKKSIKIKIDDKKDKSNESKDSSENDDVSSYKSNKKGKTVETSHINKYMTDDIMKKQFSQKKFSVALYKNFSNYKLFNFPQKKINFISLNKKITNEKDSDLNEHFANKKLSFSNREENFADIINEVKRDKIIKKTEVIKDNKVLKQFKFSGKNTNKKLNQLDKEKSLNYLFKEINKGTIPNNKFLKEYKKYFLKAKYMSEADLNTFINRDYEPKDFYNLINTVDTKIKKGDIENKWRKNYLKVGKLEGRKHLLKEEQKQDYFINHLLQYFILAQYGKVKLYEFQ